MSFTDPDVISMLVNGESKDFIFMLRLQYPGEMILVHTGIGERTYNGETFQGIGKMGSIGTIKDSSGNQAKRLQLTLYTGDYSEFSNIMNNNPMGLDGELYLAALDDNRRISGVELIYAGEIVDYGVSKNAPHAVSVTLSDWMEVWSKAARADRYTEASQKAKHPNDEFFSMVEALAKGIPDITPGTYIGKSGYAKIGDQFTYRLK